MAKQKTPPLVVPPEQLRRVFLTKLLDMLPNAHDVLLWFKNALTAEENSSFFTHDLEAGLAELTRRLQLWHCYFGVGARPRQDRQRDKWKGTEADVVSLFCANLDIDIASPFAHSETRLPPTVKDALWILGRLPTQATTIVDTGYGLGAYFFFKEAELLSTPAERIAAKDAVFRLQEAARLIAREKGWTIDSTHDLARIMRFPGTINHKGGNAKPTLILADDGPRLVGLSDLLDTYPPVKDQKPGTPGARITEVVKALSMKAPFNMNQFAAMREHNSKFLATWNKERRDLRNYSQSGYDMALVCIALATERVTPQEALSLLLEYRAKYQLLTREHYAKWTIQTAINFVEGNRHIHVPGYDSPRPIEDIAAQIVSEEEQEEVRSIDREGKLEADAEDATALFREVEAFFRFPPTLHIRRVVCVNSEPLRFEWVCETGAKQERRIVIGSPETVYDLEKIKAQVYQVTRAFCFREGKKSLALWGELSDRLRHVETTEEEIETLKEEVIRRQLDLYRERRSITFEEIGEDVTKQSQKRTRILDQGAFVEDDRFCFSLDVFLRFVLDQRNESAKFNRAVFIRTLRLLGGMDERVDFNKTTRRLWTISLRNLSTEFTHPYHGNGDT